MRHGVAKCFLFMLVGDVMKASKRRQGSSGVYLVRHLSRFGTISLRFLVLSLRGLPFIGVFFSKHYLLLNKVCSPVKLAALIMIVLGFLLSYAYSCRFMLLFVGPSRGLPVG